MLGIVNVRSGLGDPGLYDLARELTERGASLTLRFLGEHDDLQHLLEDADGYDRVIAVGGDGTISAVLYALRYRDIPVALYPAGTANLFARNLGLPSDPAELAALAIQGVPTPLDLGELDVNGGTGFFIMAGAGFDAALMDRARALKPLLGEGAYILAAAQNLQPQVATFVLDLDGRHVTTQGIAVLLVNLARIQFDLEVTHGSDARDGLLEVVVLRPAKVTGLLPAVWAALLDRIGNHSDRPGLEIHTARAIEVVASPPLPLQYDGEVVPDTTPLRARVLPRAALVVTPEGGLPADVFPD
ncbi:MAG: diacylglycerol kinase family protein [Coriobacteriales bacterium]